MVKHVLQKEILLKQCGIFGSNFVWWSYVFVSKTLLSYDVVMLLYDYVHLLKNVRKLCSAV